MTGEERTCRVQVLVDGHAVADCECLSCAVEIERGLKVNDQMCRLWSDYLREIGG